MGCHCAGMGRVFQRRGRAGDEGEMIPIPYVSQIDNAPRHNECGLACVLMLARWLGKGVANTVTELSKKYDPTDDGTTPANLVQALKDFGLTGIPKAAQYPYIELVYYAKLPFKLDPNGTFLHWIVRLSDTEYHDPYWRGSAGANLKTTKAMLDAAEVTANSRVGIVERPSEPTMTKATVITEVRVRIGPEVSDATWTPLALKEGQQLDGTVQGDFFKYADSRFVVYNKAGQRVDALYSAIKHNGIQYLTLASDPQPIPANAPPALGLNTIYYHRTVDDAYPLGCRWFVICDGNLAAVQMAQRYPDAMIIYRRVVMPRVDVNTAVQLLEINKNFKYPPNLIFTCFNEADNGIDQNGEDLKYRLTVDRQLNKICRDAGAKYAFGSFSMGTPPIETADCAAIFRDYATPMYNEEGAYYDGHWYSPLKNYKGTDPQWHSTRWRKAFDPAIGFNPSIRRVIGTEGGSDRGSFGGFVGQSTTEAEFERWCVDHQYDQGQPIEVNGKLYPSPLIAVCLYQGGFVPQWASFDTRKYWGILQKRGWK